MSQNYNELVSKLNSFIREYYKNKILKGFIYSFICLITVLIVVSLIEYFSYSNSVIRGIIFWSYVLLTSIIVTFWIILPIIKMFKIAKGIGYTDAAKIIGEHFDEVSDKLTNILELKKLNSGDTKIIEASINHKIQQIKLTPFNKAVDWSKTIANSKYLLIPVIIILLIVVSGNKMILSDSTNRIINYDEEFTRPAPFYFEIMNDELKIVEGDDFNLSLKTSGKSSPEQLKINFNGTVQRMKKNSENNFSFLFNNVQSTFSFFMFDETLKSQNYVIEVLPRAKTENIKMTVSPPAHNKSSKRIYNNSGSIDVTEGSLVKWEVQTAQAEDLQFIIGDTEHDVVADDDGVFVFKKYIFDNTNYQILISNSNMVNGDTTFYNLKVIKDRHPTIDIELNDENENIISGFVTDDYGFSSLVFVSEDNFKKKSDTIKINIDSRAQSFVYNVDDITSSFGNGDEALKCYFVICDNDAVNNLKCTNSEQMYLSPKSADQAQNEFTENINDVKNEIALELDELDDLKIELEEYEKKLIGADSLDWRDKKKLDEILKKQKAFEEKIDELKNKTQQSFEELNTFSQPSDDIIKKQKELERLFDEIMSQEMKDLFKELNELKDELDKNELQKKIQELQLSNEDLEKELDRNLEILKQVEFDQKLENLINETKELSKNQLDLSKDTLNINEKLKAQENYNNDFNKIKNDIKDLNQLNSSLENKNKISDTKDIEKSIDEKLNKVTEQLKNKNQKGASKNQKKLSDELMELANMFDEMKKNNEETQNYEDMDALRQILENLVYFSIEEEDLMLEFEGLEKDNPQYVSMMHKQQELRDASYIIEDSLFALSKRVPQISSKVNSEINAINSKTLSAINNLRERYTVKAVKDQQFVMTSANNLAVMLSEILKSMQEEMASDLPSSQQCEKPGKGSPKPGDLKRMQKELNEQIEKMKEQMLKGEKENMQSGKMSKELVEMLAKQELIRSSLEELRKNMEDKDSVEKLNEVIEEMEETEKDIANKKLRNVSLKRQKEILTKLLELDDALRKQGDDDARESKTNESLYEKILIEELKKLEIEKLKQTEMLKTQPGNLNNYYKKLVDDYFNKLLNEYE